MLQKSIYKTRTQLFEVLKFDGSFKQFGTYEYLSQVYDPENNDMS